MKSVSLCNNNKMDMKIEDEYSKKKIKQTYLHSQTNRLDYRVGHLKKKKFPFNLIPFFLGIITAISTAGIIIIINSGSSNNEKKNCHFQNFYFDTSIQPFWMIISLIHHELKKNYLFFFSLPK